MRRLLISTLLVNLASLPAMAQDAPHQPYRAEREDRPVHEKQKTRHDADTPRIARPAGHTEDRLPIARTAAAAPSAGTPPQRIGREDRNVHRHEDQRDWSPRDRDWRNEGARDEDWRQREWRDRRPHDRWTRDWRNDRRYDWRRYRDAHRPYYQLPHYRLPFGYSYGYRRLIIGLFLDRIFYAPNYWINDPWAYRLPPAHGNFRWVRYFDDVVLIDVRNGRVVDVIYDFFW